MPSTEHQHATLEESIEVLRMHDGCWEWRARVGAKVNSHQEASAEAAWTAAVQWRAAALGEARVFGTGPGPRDVPNGETRSYARPIDPLMLRAADRLYDACERAINQTKRVDARSEIGDAALDYRDMRWPDGSGPTVTDDLVEALNGLLRVVDGQVSESDAQTDVEFARRMSAAFSATQAQGTGR